MKFCQARTLDSIAAELGGSVVGSGDILVTGVSSLDKCEAGDIVFVEAPQAIERFLASEAVAALTTPQLQKRLAGQDAVVLDFPKIGLSQLLEEFLPDHSGPGIAPLIHPSAVVDPSAHLGSGVVIGARSRVLPGAVIGANTQIGQDCVIHPNVVVQWGTVMGDRVIVHSGSVLGTDGFSYVQRPTGKGGEFENVKVHQVGNVIIGDDVEIGACVCVDRAMLDSTIIEDGTKIDNQVQIAHNCHIGRDCIIVGQAGLAGSVTVGHHSILAAKVGIADHLTIAPGCIILATSSVPEDLEKPGVYVGSPVQERGKFWRYQASLFRVPAMLKAMKSLAKCKSFEEFREVVAKTLDSA